MADDPEAVAATDLGSPAHAGIDPPSAALLDEVVRGSPAHAGIDPSADHPLGLESPIGLPRTRGDRPGSAGSKRTRDHGLGSPAHAGIDPCSSGRRHDPFASRAPPHTRG